MSVDIILYYVVPQVSCGLRASYGKATRVARYFAFANIIPCLYKNRYRMLNYRISLFETILEDYYDNLFPQYPSARTVYI